LGAAPAPLAAVAVAVLVAALVRVVSAAAIGGAEQAADAAPAIKHHEVATDGPRSNRLGAAGVELSTHTTVDVDRDFRAQAGVATGRSHVEGVACIQVVVKYLDAGL